MAPAFKIAVIVLAAGKSQRMGEDKLLKRLPSGESLLENRLRMAHETGWPVFVALPKNTPARRQIAKLCNSTLVDCEASQNIGYSLAQVVKSLPQHIQGILVVLADLPGLSAADLLQVARSFDGKTVIRAVSENGQDGHPILFPARIRSRLETLTQSEKVSVILDSETVIKVRLPSDHATFDIDTPEDWAAWTDRLGLRNKAPDP